MPTFIALFEWTDQGVRKVKDTVKRAEKFKATIQTAGGSVKGFYWTMGTDWDERANPREKNMNACS